MLCVVFLACGTDVGESRCESSAGIEKVISVLAIRIPYPGNFACIVGKQKNNKIRKAGHQFTKNNMTWI